MYSNPLVGGGGGGEMYSNLRGGGLARASTGGGGGSGGVGGEMYSNPRPVGSANLGMAQRVGYSGGSQPWEGSALPRSPSQPLVAARPLPSHPRLAPKSTSNALGESMVALERPQRPSTDHGIVVSNRHTAVAAQNNMVVAGQNNMVMAAQNMVRLAEEAVKEDFAVPDDNLLALLGSMAQGACEDEGDEGDVLSGGIVDFLPVEVQFDEPPVKALINECAEAWGALQNELEHQRKYRPLKLAELDKMRLTSEMGEKEASTLRQRLKQAEDIWQEKLEEEKLAAQEFRRRIATKKRSGKESGAALSFTLSSLKKRAAELEAKVEAEDVAQATLMAELQEASDLQARMHSELEVARATASSERKRKAKLQAEFEQQQEMARSDSCETIDLHSPNFSDEVSMHVEDPALSDTSEISEDAVSVAFSAAFSDQTVQGLTDRLEAEEAAASALDEKLTVACALLVDEALVNEYLLRQIVGIRGPGTDASEQEEAAALWWEGQLESTPSTEWHEGMGDDVVCKIREALLLCQELSNADEESLPAFEAERAELEALQKELDALSEMQERLFTEEDACEAQESLLAEANAEFGSLRSEVLAEKAALDEEEHNSRQRRHQFRTQIEEQKRVLMHQRAINNEFLQQQMTAKKKKKSRFRFGGSSSGRSPAVDSTPRIGQTRTQSSLPERSPASGYTSAGSSGDGGWQPRAPTDSL